MQFFFKFSRLTPHQHRPHPLPPPRSQCPTPSTTLPQVGTEPSHSSNVVIERHLYIVLQHKKLNATVLVNATCTMNGLYIVVFFYQCLA